MTEHGDNPLDVDTAILKTTIRNLAKDQKEYTIEVRPGFEIEGQAGKEPIVRYEDCQYTIDELPHEARAEFLKASEKHHGIIKSLRQSKYLDPSTNPMIKADPGD